MSARKKQGAFDVEAFIAGVGRPTREVELCTDLEVRARVDALLGELEGLGDDDDESLAGNPRRDAILDELRTIQEDESLWTKFTVQAPTREGRVYSTLNIARGIASSDDDSENDGLNEADHFAAASLTAEARLIADCLISIGGEKVSLTHAQAEAMQRTWPDDLVQELVDAIRELGSDMTTVPFSQRLSQTLGTGTSSRS